MTGIQLGRILARQVHAPVVYFVRNGNRVKIGTTTNLQPRIARLSLSLRDVALVVPGGYEIEALYHQRFEQYRCSGSPLREWFEVRGELREFLETKPDPMARWPSPKKVPDPPLCSARPGDVLSLREFTTSRGLSLAAARIWRNRYRERFPKPQALDGPTELYLASDLDTWHEARQGARR